MKVLSFSPYNSSAAENSRRKQDHGSAAEVSALIMVRCGTHTHVRAQWADQCTRWQHKAPDTPNTPFYLTLLFLGCWWDGSYSSASRAAQGRRIRRESHVKRDSTVKVCSGLDPEKITANPTVLCLCSDSTHLTKRGPKKNWCFSYMSNSILITTNASQSQFFSYNKQSTPELSILKIAPHGQMWGWLQDSNEQTGIHSLHPILHISWQLLQQPKDFHKMLNRRHGTYPV